MSELEPQTSPVSLKFLLGLFCLVFFTYGYFFQAGGVNENARLDQTRSIAELGRLDIEQFSWNTGDVIRVQGKIYPDKIPGTSFFGVPHWWFFRHYFKFLPLQESVKVHVITYLVIWTTIGFMSALTAVLLYSVLECLTLNPVYSLLLTLSYSFGTIAFPFSTTFFGHQLSASLLFASFFLIFAYRENCWKAPSINHMFSSWVRKFRSPWFLLLSGLCSGYALVVEYPNLLAVAPITLYAFLSVKKKWLILFYITGLCLGLSFLLAYNLAVFGKPFFITYSVFRNMHPNPYPDHSLGFMGVQFPKISQLLEITFRPQRGLFYINPWLAGIIPAIPLALILKKRKLEAMIAGVIVVGFFVFNAGFGTNIVFWGGGFSTGPRYLVPMLPFAVILVAPLLGFKIVRRLFYVLALFSIAAMLLATAVEPRVSYEYRNPLWNFFWKNYLEGHLALSGGGPFNAQRLTVNSVAFNWGKLLRLPGPFQLLPLLVFWLWVFNFLLAMAQKRHTHFGVNQK